MATVRYNTVRLLDPVSEKNEKYHIIRYRMICAPHVKRPERWAIPFHTVLYVIPRCKKIISSVGHSGGEGGRGVCVTSITVY